MNIENQIFESDLDAEKRKILRIQTEGLPLHTVLDVKNARKELEQAISALVADFEERSRCTVTAVESRQSTAGSKPFWRVEVRL